jgi:hypothetical protein
VGRLLAAIEDRVIDGYMVRAIKRCGLGTLWARFSANTQQASCP